MNNSSTDPEIQLVSSNAAAVQNTDSVVLKVENSNPAGTREPTRRNSMASMIQNSGISSFLTCYIPIPKTLYYPLCCLLFICLIPIAYILITIITVFVLPFLLASLIIIRILQFFIRGEDCEKIFTVKVLIRYWIFVDVVLLLIEIGIFLPFATNVTALKHVTIIGLSLSNWFNKIAMLIGLNLLNQVIWMLIFWGLYNILDESSGPPGFTLLEATSEIIGCLLFWLAETNLIKSVPYFMQHDIFGLYTHKWIEAFLFLLIGYNVITLITHSVPWVIPRFFPSQGEKSYEKLATCICCSELTKGMFDKRYVVYIANGMKRSITFILTAFSVLLTWHLYFRPRVGKQDDKADNTKKIVTLTLVSVTICSILWMIKTCTLLYWEAHAVYDRLHDEIAEIGKHFYFLVLLSYSHYCQSCAAAAEWDAGNSGSNKSSCCGGTTTSSEQQMLWYVKENEKKDSFGISRKLVRRDLINNTGTKASTNDVQQTANYFMIFKYVLTEDTTLSTDLRHLRRNTDQQEDNRTLVAQLKEMVNAEGKDFSQDWTLFNELLEKMDPSTEISFSKIKLWMETAHSRCRFLSNTLSSQKEVVGYLNKVLCGIIIIATFILWLLITGFATTNVLVLLASPFLAVTFIFGDTCKSLFQGLVFIYIVHSFDVGDLCLIDGELMEVKSISVWSTSFSKVRTIGTQQGIIYPNSQLATKNYINYKTKFDWSDYVEFSINSPDKETTKHLQDQIKSYLDGETEKFTPNFHSVVMLEIGENIKIAIHVKYNICAEGWTYFQCLKEKEKLRFDFALSVQDLVNQRAKLPKSSVISTINGQETIGIESENSQNPS